MEKQLKDGVVYQTFKTKKELQETILNMIFNSKMNKILYKGNPFDINYKLMKKVMYKDYTKSINPDIVRKGYFNVVNSCEEQKYCIIFKK